MWIQVQKEILYLPSLQMKLLKQNNDIEKLQLQINLITNQENELQQFLAVYVMLWIWNEVS